MRESRRGRMATHLGPRGPNLLLLTVLACQQPSPVDWPSIRMSDGREVSSLIVREDTIALLVLDPGHCFSCGGEIAAWRGWETRSPARRVRIVLSRQPTKREAEELARQRIPVAGMISDSLGSEVPVVILYARGELRDSATGESRARALMLRWQF